MTYSNSSEAVEALASEIGKNVYIDVAKWHLYLGDAHLSKPLAEQLYPMLEDGLPAEDQVLSLLRSLPVKLGGGKHEVPLVDLLPVQAQIQLMDTLEEFHKQL